LANALASAIWTENLKRHESGLPQPVMSALPLEADMCSALAMSAVGQQRASPEAHKKPGASTPG
jgi:hypothetical protein